jgi:hypothetical protein
LTFLKFSIKCGATWEFCSGPKEVHRFRTNAWHSGSFSQPSKNLNGLGGLRCLLHNSSTIGLWSKSLEQATHCHASAKESSNYSCKRKRSKFFATCASPTLKFLQVDCNFSCTRSNSLCRSSKGVK